MSKVIVYGRDWCEDSQRTRAHLEAIGVPFRYLNTDEDPAAEAWAAKQNRGKLQTPTVRVDGRVLIEPSNSQLDRVLREQSSRSRGATRSNHPSNTLRSMKKPGNKERRPHRTKQNSAGANAA